MIGLLNIVVLWCWCVVPVWSRETINGVNDLLDEFTTTGGNGGRLSVEGHHFHMVFGSERVNSHYTSHNEFNKAIENVQQSSQYGLNDHTPQSSTRRSLSSTEKIPYDDEMSYLACVLYINGPQAKESLMKVYGYSHVSTVHVSHSDNRVCFLVSTSRSRLQQVMEGRTSNIHVQNNHFSSGNINTLDLQLFSHLDFIIWSPVPAPLKLHPSTLYYLDLMDHHPHKPGLLHTSTMKNPFPSSIDLQKTSIVLTITKSEDSDVVSRLTKRIREALSIASDSDFLLDHIFQLYGSKGHLWSVAAAEWSRGVQDFSTHESNACNFAELDVTETENQISLSGIAKIQEQSEYPTACLAALMAVLAHQSQVVDIRLRHEKTSFNNYIKSIVQSEVYAQGEEMYPYLQAGLDGTGQVVGIGDSGLDELSCFFNEGDDSLMERSNFSAPVTDMSRRKVVQYVAYKGGDDTPGGHGTHVSGTVAGSVVSSPATQQSEDDLESMKLYGGHAPSAKIAFFDMSEDGNSIYYPSPLGDNVFGPAWKAGAHLHTNSWGGPFNFYDSDTISADDFQVQHDDFLALFAAGNDGSDGYFSVADPAVSKNSLTVGASMTNRTIERVAFFSSLGPTFDQRIKPDVVAPGYFTYSACAGGAGNSTCTVLRHAGTSMATPAVAGTAALVRQYFSGDDESILESGTSYYQLMCQESYPLCKAFSPRGATVKAILIHSGEAMEEYFAGTRNTTEPTAPLINSPPDMYQGFGRIALPNVLPYPGIEEGLDLYVEELEIASMQEVTYTVVVQNASKPLKVTLVWMDPVNHIITSRLLLHDIDLQVISSTGEVYHGNNQPGDEMNNVEQVSIVTPSVDVAYEVRLQAKTFTESVNQKISLVITSGGGEVSNKVVTDNSDTFTYNALDCSDDEQMVVIRKADRGGDGWNDAYYIIQHLDASSQELTVVLNATMKSTASTDIIGYDYICLTVGEVYNISLHDSTTASSGSTTLDSQIPEMGVTIQQCGVYLSEYQMSNVISIVSAESCNPCSGGNTNTNDVYPLEVVLVGSLYGIPYGWKGTSKYVLQDQDDFVVSEGTLLVGMLEERSLCLPSNSSFQLTLDDVPLSDDFLDDDFLAQFLGVEEYQIGVLGCNNTNYWNYKREHPDLDANKADDETPVVGRPEDFVVAKSGHVIYIQIGPEGQCEMYVDSLPSQPSIPLPWYLEIVVTVIASMICSGMIIACMYCRGLRPSPKGEDTAHSKLVNNMGGGSSSITTDEGNISVNVLNYEEEDDHDHDDDSWDGDVRGLSDENLSSKTDRKNISSALSRNSLSLSSLRRGKSEQKPTKHEYVKFASDAS